MHDRIIAFRHLPAVVVVSMLLALLPPSSVSRPHQSPNSIRIVLVGDSTVTDEAGWGAGFRQLVTDQAEVINQAASGRSSKSYIDEGRWAEALAKRGHYYLIQFGHNDEPGKGPGAVQWSRGLSSTRCGKSFPSCARI